MKPLLSCNLYSIPDGQPGCDWGVHGGSFDLHAWIAGPEADAGTAASFRRLNLESNFTSGRRRQQLAPT